MCENWPLICRHCGRTEASVLTLFSYSLLKFIEGAEVSAANVDTGSVIDELTEPDSVDRNQNHHRDGSCPPSSNAESPEVAQPEPNSVGSVQNCGMELEFVGLLAVSFNWIYSESNSIP